MNVSDFLRIGTDVAGTSRIDAAITEVNDSTRSIGIRQPRLTTKEKTISTAIEIEAAKSRIMDTDLALEQLEVSKLQILQETALIMLAQANATPQNVLQLSQ